MILKSPLDQFRIVPVYKGNSSFLDFSFTNSAFIEFLALAGFLFLTYLFISPEVYLKKKESGIFLVPNNRWFLILEDFYKTICSLLNDNVGIKGENYFPFYSILFLYILLSNLIGLIPYSFTSTSHIIITFSLAIILFFGTIRVGINSHQIHFLNLFLPSGTALPLAFLLVPLEIVSFFSKPISLSVRLFANMMAGHTLLKVIAGFGWDMMKGGGILFLGHLFPILVLFLLVGLELGVGIIQSYVFTVLGCIYLNDSINLH